MGSDVHATSGTVEARYAFTNWNVVPLNPAISAEYIFGWGKSVRSASQDSKRRGNGLREQPAAVALRLLLGQDLAGRIGYGFNFSLTQDVTRDSGREIGLSQSITCGAMKGKLELGAEMRYTHSTERLSLGPEDELVCGPTIGWKPTRQIRVSFAPLFGATSESARVATFLLVSYEFGGAEAIVPSVSTLDR